jgi:hypothetical protein
MKNMPFHDLSEEQWNAIRNGKGEWPNKKKYLLCNEN